MTFATRKRIILGIASLLLLFCTVTVSSDLALKKQVDGGPCALEVLMTSQAGNDVCAITSAPLVDKYIHYGKGGSRYELVARQPSQSSIYIHLPGDSVARHFFDHLRVGDPLRMETVVKKGYYLSGRVIAVAGNDAANQTLNAPAMHLRMDVIQGLFGVVLLVLALVMRDRSAAASSGNGGTRTVKTTKTIKYTVTYRSNPEE